MYHFAVEFIMHKYWGHSALAHYKVFKLSEQLLILYAFGLIVNLFYLKPQMEGILGLRNKRGTKSLKLIWTQNPNVIYCSLSLEVVVTLVFLYLG